MYIIIKSFCVGIILRLIQISWKRRGVVSVCTDDFVLCIIQIQCKKLILFCKAFSRKIPAPPVIILHTAAFFLCCSEGTDQILFTIDRQHFRSYIMDKRSNIRLHFGK